MEPLEAVEIVARRARAEIPPLTHVSMATVLRAGQSEQLRLAPLAWSAGLSAVAACIVVAIALHGNYSTTNSSTGTDSIAPLFNAAQVQMP